MRGNEIQMNLKIRFMKLQVLSKEGKRATHTSVMGWISSQKQTTQTGRNKTVVIGRGGGRKTAVYIHKRTNLQQHLAPVHFIYKMSVYWRGMKLFINTINLNNQHLEFHCSDSFSVIEELEEPILRRILPFP